MKSNFRNKTMRDSFFDSLYKIAKKDKNVYLITADMGAPSLDKYRVDLKGQFINVGIAEENMVLIATGLSLCGKKVYIYAIMPFVTARCYEMLKVDLSLMNIPVTAIGVGAGFGYDDSGPTHHSTEDISIMRALPNFYIFSPSDSLMAYKLAEMTYKLKFPSYVRLDRKVLPLIYNKNDNFSDGLSVLKNGKDFYIIGTGNMTHRAIEVAEELEKFNINAGVIDLYRIKPINAELLIETIKATKGIITIEEHLLAGGMGSAIIEVLIDNGINLPVKRFGVKDKYLYAYGGRENIQKICGLDKESIVKDILNWKAN
ncbi:MAG: 1-deoxy-D-xylulose-5-phosphate synthase [Candidatus Omnitrophica bacterium]|nr:1-deoxy-D-xylulose-5-phosphate synthase [Candidatus Omnitrophota bacterium]MCM8832702.1 1-deoxy-D-xylulose-5-phosphate synthase [Candidatus Omnitrophota bacterium]